MPDNKQHTGKQDRIRIDANDASEVEYIHRKFPELSHQAIIAAIKTAGPMRKEVIRYLGERGKEDKK